jgi:hypothetical protein
MNNQQFTERQKLQVKGMWILYLLLWLILFLFGYAVVQQVILHKPFGDKPAPDFLLVGATVFIVLVMVSFYIARLETVITRETISYRWAPFQKFTVINWSDVAKADVFDFGFVGAGYRFTPYGTVHTGGANKGLRLKMTWGKTLILGTKKPEELEGFLTTRCD